MQSKATTVTQYLAGLPSDRRKTIEDVRKVIRRKLPEGYQEMINWGAIPADRYIAHYEKTRGHVKGKR